LPLESIADFGMSENLIVFSFRSVIVVKSRPTLAFFIIFFISVVLFGCSQVGTLSPLHHWLPLGDGKVSSQPQTGYVFACPTPPGPPLGSDRQGEWIQGEWWNPEGKPVVDGEVFWGNTWIETHFENNQRVIRANNVPYHPTGIFPISPNDDAYQYDRNPNALRDQNILLTLPIIPTEADQPSCLPMGMIGFANTGVAIYSALDAQQRDAPAHEIQDQCKGHPEVSGQYHYHDWSDCIEDFAGRGGQHSSLIGYALDGFGIFGFWGEYGQELHNFDLDACHGHKHWIIWEGGWREMYHYHITHEYPYTLGCFKGQVNAGNPPPPPMTPPNP
jgi:hypothetical protein